MNARHHTDIGFADRVDKELEAAELIKSKLATCCADYNVRGRIGQPDVQSPLARAIEMLRPSLGSRARQRAIGLMNRYARQAVASGMVSGNADRSADGVLFCTDCGWTGEQWETAADCCPSCRFEGSAGRLVHGDPLNFHHMSLP